MKTIAIIIAVLGLAATMRAEVVRPAPDFRFVSAKGSSSSLRSLRGQPVIFLIAESPRSGKFRKQVGMLDDIYRKFASRDMVFISAFTQSDERARSDIPFTYAVDPLQSASAYGSDGGFRMAVIGVDGNMDLITSEVQSPDYILSVISNAYPIQKKQRTE